MRNRRWGNGLTCLAGFLLGLSAYARSARETKTELIWVANLARSRDARTGQPVVSEGHPVRLGATITARLTAPTEEAARQLAEALPHAVDAYFERTDERKAVSVHFRPLSFKRQSDGLACLGKERGRRICEAVYAASKSMQVDLPAGEVGEHGVSLVVLPPDPSDARVEVPRPVAYRVIAPKRDVTSAQWASAPGAAVPRPQGSGK